MPQLDVTSSKENLLFRWPGDEYVDFIGMDSYHGTNTGALSANAKILEEFGLSRVLDQESTTPYKLLAELESFVSKIGSIKESVKEKEFVPANGQEKLGNAIIQLISS